MARIICVINQKGGTGKTTTVINVSACLAQKGHRTLIIDIEPQANASLSLGVNIHTLEKTMYDVLLDKEVGLDEIITETAIKNLMLAPTHIDLANTDINLANKEDKRFRLKDKIATMRGKFDYILIDCPPSLSLLPINALVASKEVIIPLLADYLSMEGLVQLTSTVDKIRNSLNPELKILGILFCMVDRRMKMTGESIEIVRERFNELVFNTMTSLCVKLKEATSLGQTIFEYDLKSKGALDYQNLTEEIINRGNMLYKKNLFPLAVASNRIKEFFDIS